MSVYHFCIAYKSDKSIGANCKGLNLDSDRRSAQQLPKRKKCPIVAQAERAPQMFFKRTVERLATVAKNGHWPAIAASAILGSPTLHSLEWEDEEKAPMSNHPINKGLLACNSTCR